MTYKKNVLVVANITAASDDLCRALTERAEREPAAFTLLVPATSPGAKAAAKETVAGAVARLQEAGLEASGMVGDCDPIVAVTEAWDPRRYDEIVVCTLPIGSSKWLHAGLPERVFKLTGVQVTHIVAQPHRPVPEPVHVEAHDDSSLLGPLTVLGWSKRHEGDNGTA